MYSLSVCRLFNGVMLAQKLQGGNPLCSCAAVTFWTCPGVHGRPLHVVTTLLLSLNVYATRCLPHWCWLRDVSVPSEEWQGDWRSLQRPPLQRGIACLALICSLFVSLHAATPVLLSAFGRWGRGCHLVVTSILLRVCYGCRSLAMISVFRQRSLCTCIGTIGRHWARSTLHP